jgi:uncharacterized protein (TIGR04255 family)
MKRSLPEFNHPPITEVALSVQFANLDKWQSTHTGLLWSKYREAFPRTEQHPPVGPVVESFGPPRRQDLQLEIVNSAPPIRAWFLNSAGTELIQVQSDRFIHNWRKVESVQGYPRYAHICRQFLNELDQFCKFLEDEKLGAFVPNQCEVTYINHISLDSGNVHKQAEEVLTMWRPSFSDDYLQSANGIELEDSRVGARFVIKDSENTPIGRLHFSTQPLMTISDGKPGKPVLGLTLTARGAPIGTGKEGVLKFMDLGHETIVNAFASLTTAKMHNYWGRTL